MTLACRQDLPDVAAADGCSNPSESRKGDAVCIVLIDDHPLIRNGTAALLESGGHTIVGEAGDGEEGLHVVREALPHLVVVDLHMPVLDGVEATRLLKAEHPDPKVLILTASGSINDLRAAQTSGADGCLFKDARASELFEAIDALGYDGMAFPVPTVSRFFSANWRQPLVPISIIGGLTVAAGLLLALPTGVADRLPNSSRGMDIVPTVLMVGGGLIGWSTAAWRLVDRPDLTPDAVTDMTRPPSPCRPRDEHAPIG